MLYPIFVTVNCHAMKQFSATLGNRPFLWLCCGHKTLRSSYRKTIFQNAQITPSSVLQIQDASQAKVSDLVVFAGPPVTEQVLWPRHCVQDSWGAEFHKDLKVRLPDCITWDTRYIPNPDATYREALPVAVVD